MLSVASARLPTGDAPVCGVPLLPYVLIHRGDAPGAVAGDEVPEEGSAAAEELSSLNKALEAASQEAARRGTSM